MLLRGWCTGGLQLEKPASGSNAPTLRNPCDRPLVKLYDQIEDEIVPFLQIQFTEAAEGKGWRVKLDTEMLSILIGDKIKPKDLMPLYELLAQEPYHWLAE